MTDATMRGYPLPHPDNIAREDAQRIRDALQAIDGDIGAVSDDVATSLLAAAENRVGRVRLATAAEATAGTATNAVPTVKRVKDMILALLDVLEDTVASLQSQVDTDKDALQADISDLGTSVAASLAARVLLAGGQTLKGGFDADGYVVVANGGTFVPNPKLGNFQAVQNAGTHTLNPPATPCSMVLQYWNNGAAGLTVAGFNKVTGATFNSANGGAHLLYITRHVNWAHVHIVAL